MHLNVPNANYERLVRDTLRAAGTRLSRVRIHHIATNECWTRDHGPAFVQRRRGGRVETAVVDWGFNAWGGKYPPWDADDAVPTRVAAALGLPVFHADIVMEGGAIDVNGDGTLLTTTSCLLNRNRNPQRTKAEIEHYLKAYYGQRHVVWLGDGIAGDDTDGHVDDLARFVDARTIVTAIETDPRDANYHVLADNRRRLDRARDADGRPFTVVEVPMPRPVVLEGQRLPATYVNFLFVNGGLLVPTFGDRTRDRAALARLQAVVPRRRSWVWTAGRSSGPGRDSLPDAAAAGRALIRRLAAGAPVSTVTAWAHVRPGTWWRIAHCRERPGRRSSAATRSAS